MKIAILQKYNNKVECLADMTTVNKVWYAERRGYVFINDTTKYELEPGRSDTWLIELSICNTMKKYPDVDWIFWTDIDSLIMNYTVKLENLIQTTSNDEHIIACMWPIQSNYTFSDLTSQTITVKEGSSTWFFLHTGNWLVRNCEWSYNFLTTLYNDKRFILQEQLRTHFIGDEIGITCYYLAYPEIRKHIKILSNQILLTIPEKSSNSFIKNFSIGDFIFHVPLQPLKIKEAWLHKVINLCEK